MITDEAKLLIFGGYTEKGYSNELYEIDLFTFKAKRIKTKEENTPSPRENFAIAFQNKRLWIFGGFQQGGVVNDVYSIDTISYKWLKVETQGSSPKPRQGPAYVRAGNRLYIAGGCDPRTNSCFNDFHILNLESLFWTEVLSSSKDLRGEHSMVFFRGSLYTFGGCEMFKACFNSVQVINISDICPNRCSRHGTCSNQLGCFCDKGFILGDCSLQVQCYGGCSQRGECLSSGLCLCYPGYKGLDCSQEVNCLRNCTDSVHGTCGVGGLCDCKDGFSGEDCSTEVFKEGK